MKKYLFISTLLASLLMGAKIEISEFSSDAKRVLPEGNEVILSYYDSIKDAKKSVVNISTSKHIKRVQGDEFFDNPMLREFFGNKFPKKEFKDRKARSLGSGVIISSNGYIITNNHVVEGADEITVMLHDSEKEYKAKIVGLDPKTDLGVIKIEEKNLNFAKFGNSHNLKEGDIVFAIGNPFGIGESITQGIVSALNKTDVGINQYENFIQTDASINPGNSGGALVDTRGALVGINSAIISKSGGNNGIGFAIPSSMAKSVAISLIENGTVERGYLGVSVGDLSEDLKEMYKNKNGAVILAVEKDAPADRAKLRRGDLIVEINGQRIKNGNDLKNIVGSFLPNSAIEIKYERDKKEHTVSTKLEKLGGDANLDGLISGLRLKNLENEHRYEYKIPLSIEGVFVEEVVYGSVGEKIGFQEGDVIVQVESYPILSIDDLKKSLKDLDKKKKRIYVNRQGYIIILVIN